MTFSSTYGDVHGGHDADGRCEGPPETEEARFIAHLAITHVTEGGRWGDMCVC